MIRVAALVAVLLLSGCGSSTRTVTRLECNGIAADLTVHYAICGGHRFVRDGEPLPIQVPPGAKVGHWAKAFLSPDGKTFLAEWSAECEVPVAFFVAAKGGTPRAVTGERDWSKAAESIADGWTGDGRAIVEVRGTGCGPTTARSGLYLVQPEGRRKLVEPPPP